MNLDIILQEFKDELQKLYGSRLDHVILYGSWARGEGTEQSDIDLLVVLHGQISPGREIDNMIDIVTEMNLKYDILLSICPISDKDYSNTKSPLLINIRKEGIPA